MQKNITEKIAYIGVDDLTIDFFESQYVVPNGISYNSYIIMDDKIAVIDTVDSRMSDAWWDNLEKALNGRIPDYLIVQHMEPDHSGNIAAVLKRYPAIKIVASERGVAMMPQFFCDVDFSSNTISVKEGDSISLGEHTLRFVMAPMVHWPEVMVTYDETDKVLFSADAFGKFGALCHDEEWVCEARRYYFNICGKYGNQVQQLLKKATALNIEYICPLHGPVLSENLGYYIGLYDTWSRYDVETDGVLVAYASIHGGTAVAAKKMADILREKGTEKVTVVDLCRCDMAEAVEDAFRMSKMVVAASSYDAHVFPPMHDFLHHLQMKGYRKRRVGVIENGSWAPTAGRVMKTMLECMKDVEIVEPMVSIRSRMKPEDIPSMEALAESLLF